MPNLKITDLAGGSVEEVNLGKALSGTEKTTRLAVKNPTSDLWFTNVRVTVFDNTITDTTRKVALGGDGIVENIGNSYIYGSLDGTSWVQLKGTYSQLLVTPSGTTMYPSSMSTFYLKIAIPDGIVLNAQELDIRVLGDRI